MGTLNTIIRRDLRLALRQGADTLMVLAFFILAVSLFPFGVGPELAVLARISGGVVWVTALLASMLSLDRLFQADYEDGTLDLLVTSPAPLELITAGKVIAHWLTTGLPLVLTAPLLGMMMQLPEGTYGVLIATMVLGTPTLSFIGAIGAALVLGARRGGVLMSLLVLPLYVPVLIFGAGAVEYAATGRDFTDGLLFLGAGLFISGAVCLLAVPIALRQATN